MMIRKLIYTTLFLLIATSLHAQDDIYVEVQFQIYSGEPNPSWKILAADLEKLRSLIRGLTPIEEFSESKYGSFLLVADESKCQFPEKVIVDEGKIMAVTADGEVRYLLDENGLYDYLVTLAVEELEGVFLPAE